MTVHSLQHTAKQEQTDTVQIEYLLIQSISEFCLHSLLLWSASLLLSPAVSFSSFFHSVRTYSCRFILFYIFILYSIILHLHLASVHSLLTNTLRPHFSPSCSSISNGLGLSTATISFCSLLPVLSEFAPLPLLFCEHLFSVCWFFASSFSSLSAFSVYHPTHILLNCTRQSFSVFCSHRCPDSLYYCCFRMRNPQEQQHHQDHQASSHPLNGICSLSVVLLKWFRNENVRIYERCVFNLLLVKRK